MIWYKTVIAKLQASGLFQEVRLIGAKVRAFLDETWFLDIYFSPVTKSYSYALLDLRLPYTGDKRVFGWDDYPHEGVTVLEQLESYPHHFQRRTDDGSWVFESSPMRGNVEDELDIIIAAVQAYLG